MMIKIRGGDDNEDGDGDRDGDMECDDKDVSQRAAKRTNPIHKNDIQNKREYKRT